MAPISSLVMEMTLDLVVGTPIRLLAALEMILFLVVMVRIRCVAMLVVIP